MPPKYVSSKLTSQGLAVYYNGFLCHRYGLKPETVTNYYYILSQNTIDETIDTRLTEKERRMTEIMESMPIPLFTNISEDLGDDDIKALLRDYVRRTKKP